MNRLVTEHGAEILEPNAAGANPHLEDKLWDESRVADPHHQHDKAARVRAMFDRIAPTYERVNSITSAGRDRVWRMEAVRLAKVKATDRVLDIACGTGNLLAAFSRAGPKLIVGLDFAREMLIHSANKMKTPAGCCLGDALKLPFADNSFDITSCAFGVRNFQDLKQGFEEMFRVLSPGGQALILEFALPLHPLTRKIYLFYFTKVMSQLARWVSRDSSGAYQYLPSSVKTFMSPARMKDMLAEVGFQEVQINTRTCGIVFILRATKPPISHSKGVSSRSQG